MYTYTYISTYTYMYFSEKEKSFYVVQSKVFLKAELTN